MFCQKCGKQIPDNSKFCNGCGAQIAYVASSQQTNNNSAPRNGAQQPKKKFSFLGTALVVAVVFFLAKGCGYIVGNSYAKSEPKEVEPTISISSTIAIEPAVTNSEYSKVFTDRYIVFVPTVFFDLESDCYVQVTEDGLVDHQQFGHKNDIVVEFIETVYVPVEGWSDADKQAYEQTIRETYGNTGMDFVTLKYVNTSGNYISFALEMKDMDKTENVRAAADAGIIMMDDTYSLWGMSDTENALLAEGYIKK